MILKRLTLQGFKSFADRTEFEFGPGLTMIVGPNGCGKSNVVDAIKWVLGEQSPRSLRGHRMSDVVFNGSRSRKPASLAEVYLTFENSDGRLASAETEVTVGRRLFRSGESEYLLNGKPCRLKDVRDLFLDTGVGVDAYSVIEQGRVDVLIQANPLERRIIFEEAAGISRYKVRRAEAERKLERARQNLLRLDDVIAEVERQLRSVKLAAGKARSYLECDARLRELKSAFALAEYHRLSESRARIDQRRAELAGELGEKRARLTAHDAEGAEQAGALQRLDERIVGEEAAQSELAARDSACCERIRQDEQRLADYAGQRAAASARVEDAARRAEESAARIEQQRQAIAALAERMERQRAALGELEHRHVVTQSRHAELESALETCRSEAFEAARRRSLAVTQQQHVARERERLERAAQAQAARLAALAEEASALSRRRESSALEGAALSRAADQLAADVRRLDEALSALDDEFRRVDEQVTSLRETRSAAVSRLQLLEDMERRREGVSEAAQALLGWGAACGVVGLVADLLRIDDPRVVLLGPVLAGFENHVVVESAPALLRAREERPPLPGPVGIIALDRLVAPEGAARDGAAPGVVDCARNWVSCEARLEPLADALLGRTFIVESLERALTLSAEAPWGTYFVAPGGEVACGGGRVVLGGTAAATGLISRKTEIRLLRQQVDEIETGLERTVRRRSALAAERGDLQLQRQGRIEEIAALQRRHVEAQTALAHLEDDAARLEREHAALTSERAAVERSLEQASRELTSIEAECRAADAAERDAQARLEDLGAARQSAAAELEALSESLHAARVELSRAAERRAAAEEALARLADDTDQARREGAAAGAEVEQIAARATQVEAEIAAARAEHEALSAEAERRRAGLLALRQERQELRNRIEASAAASRAVQGEIGDLEAAASQTAVELREAEVRIEGLRQRVAEELAIDLAERYAGYAHAEQDWDAIRAEMDELRGRIDRLGHVNLDAIRELEELTPRHEHLVAQRADLQSSIARLESLIDELNRESRERFTRAFEVIRGHFQELFRKLFGGGKADMLLEDPEQPLECGIEVVAKPPGKEPQSISLLSGGEKTMTAVALLLAVFQSKPSPFAILDEVDAALDEANNERFNGVVQEFLAHSQFIIITHSKVTMHCADVLYGVTMQEAGVSKRVSVRFDDRVSTPSVA